MGETETMREEHQAGIGARIARLREAQGWSQRALARWVGLDQSAVSRIEAGHRRLTADELQRFAEALSVSADDLLKGTQPGPVAHRAPELPVARSHAQARATRTDDASRPAPAGSTAEGLLLDAGIRGEEPNAVAPLGLRVDAGRADVEAAMRGGAPRVPTRSSHEVPIPAHAVSTVPGLPRGVAAVVDDWFALRALAGGPAPAQRWSTGHSAEGKPERIAHTAGPARPAPSGGDVLYDRVARFWRSELHVDPDEGPLPDLVPLVEDGFGAQVIVARVADEEHGAGSVEQPVAAAFTSDGVPFLFVNAARPVALQRYALAHAFAHHVLGHGDVVDGRIEWNRNVPPEAAANDFAEEFLAPVRAVQRWYERHGAQRPAGLDDLLALGNAFGVSAWAALYRSRAAGRLPARQFPALRAELHAHEWHLLPRQAYLGGLRDTLAHLTPDEALPPGMYGAPAVLRVPAPMRAWALAALAGGRVSLEGAAALLRRPAGALAEQLARLGLE
jgi:transcriptional regulator with XRE-family HTH domain/Zn-dependent peptidase ImmA (M78 family)